MAVADLGHRSDVDDRLVAQNGVAGAVGGGAWWRRVRPVRAAACTERVAVRLPFDRTDGSSGRAVTAPRRPRQAARSCPRGDLTGLGLVLGPVAFIAAWATAGARMPGYDPTRDAISRTAAAGAPERPLMTAGFLAFAGCAAVGSVALRRHVPGPAWIAMAVNGAATVGVALTPLDHSAAVDAGHAVTATTGYVALAATPLLAAKPLAEAGHPGLARASVATGVAVGACLAATAGLEDSGLAQRIGITTGDAWLVAAGLAILAGRTLVEPDVGA